MLIDRTNPAMMEETAADPFFKPFWLTEPMCLGTRPIVLRVRVLQCSGVVVNGGSGNDDRRIDPMNESMIMIMMINSWLQA